MYEYSQNWGKFSSASKLKNFRHFKISPPSLCFPFVPFQPLPSPGDGAPYYHPLSQPLWSCPHPYPFPPKSAHSSNLSSFPGSTSSLLSYLRATGLALTNIFQGPFESIGNWRVFLSRYIFCEQLTEAQFWRNRLFFWEAKEFIIFICFLHVISLNFRVLQTAVRSVPCIYPDDFFLVLRGRRAEKLRT